MKVQLKVLFWICLTLDSEKANDDLLDAAMRDNTPDAQTALSGKADPNAPRDMYDLTPLHYAAHHGNAEIVNMLLVSCDQPANVFSQDADGRMPIHRAIFLKSGALNRDGLNRDGCNGF